MLELKANSPLYRLSTMCNAFKTIYKLSPKEVDDFISAYDIFACDWVDGKAVKDAENVSYSLVKENVITWYSLLNHLCALGQVEKMYIPPTMDLNASLIDNQIMIEQRFARELGMKKDDQVFELGCGRGRVTAQLASFTGANINAINIDQSQLDNAVDFAQKTGLAEKCKFMNRDLNDIPFPFKNDHFDCIYEIQALSYARSPQKLFHELARILKPGGRISLVEWVHLENYDPKNNHHANLMRKIKEITGAIGTPSPADYEKYLNEAGFDVLISEDHSINKSQEPVIRKASSFYDKSLPFIKFLTKIKILPKHIPILLERLSRYTDELCEADRLGLVAMSYHIIAQKRS